MQLPPNLAIKVHNKEELFKAVLICGSYKLYWYKIEKIFPLKESIFTNKKYLCFSTLFLEECNNRKVGNRLLKPSFIVVKPGLSLFYLGKLSNFFTQIIQHFITFSVHGAFFAGDFFQWFTSTFKR